MSAFNDLLYLVFQLLMLFVVYNGLKTIWIEWVRPYMGYTRDDIPWIEEEIESLENLKKAIIEGTSKDDEND